MGHLVRLSYPEAPSGSWSATTHADSTVPATAYSDFSCTAVKTSRTLNASGRDTFYVTETVDVIVSNAAGLAVDAFTEGTRAELVGVDHASWTGTESDGSQGLGGATDLPSVLTALAASFGSTDGYVKETGQSNRALLKDALAAVRGTNFPYFNVTAAPYNASNGGVVSATTGIQQAINAATAAGGGIVLFPAGTYLLTSGLSITNNKVSLRGDGPKTSVLSYAPAVGYAITVSTGTFGTTVTNYVSDLGITCTSAGGLSIQATATPYFAVRRCAFLNTGFSPGQLSFTTPFVLVDNFIFGNSGGATRGVVEVPSGADIYGQINGNIFVGTGEAVYIGAGVTAALPTISCSGNVCKGMDFLSLGAGGNYSVNGTSLDTAATCAVRADVAGASAANIAESGTAGPPTAYGILNNAVGLAGAVSSSSRARSVDDGSGTTITPVSYIQDHLFDISATPVTIAAPAPATAWNGATLVLRMRNTTGAPAVMNYNAAYLQAGVVPGNLAAGATRVSVYVRKETGTTPGWRLESSLDST